MATPKYTALLAKTREWCNKPDANTISDSIIADCLRYSADDCYRTLRIPPLEHTSLYTVTEGDNQGENSLGLPYGNAFTTIDIPADLTQFIHIRTLAADNLSEPYATFPSNISKVFHEVSDTRTFFDANSEKYSVYNWMWMDNKVYIHPQLAVGAVLEIHYYRRLPALDAQYTVSPENYVLGMLDNVQPYLSVGVATDTPLYFSGSGVDQRVFDNSADAEAYATPVTSQFYVGKEADNWLRDSNERLLIWGALQYLGGFIFDEKMTASYYTRFQNSIEELNKEERKRRASGGNVRININAGGLI